jgi:hypothetical protein
MSWLYMRMQPWETKPPIEFGRAIPIEKPLINNREPQLIKAPMPVPSGDVSGERPQRNECIRVMVTRFHPL